MKIATSKGHGQPDRKLHGNVNLTLPVSWHLIGGMLFLAVFTAVIFLSLATYSRVETVQGIVVPASGAPQIAGQRRGIVRHVFVREGEVVEAGTVVVEIATDELSDGGPAADQLTASLGEQDTLLQQQQAQVMLSTRAEQNRMISKVQGLHREIGRIREQIETQQDLIDSAAKDLTHAESVAKSGFVSKRDLLAREETLLSRRQQLSSLRQALDREQSAVDQTTDAADGIRADTAIKVAALNAQRATLHQNKVSVSAASAYRLIAPISGKVTGLTARVGQPIAEGQALMTIVPVNSRLIAELHVPNSAYGFVKVGQEVGIALDTFPYERFGTLKGRIASVAVAPVMEEKSKGSPQLVFLVTAEIDHKYMVAYGEKRQLTPGMTLTANVVTEKQSLLRWLFDPIFAIANR